MKHGKRRHTRPRKAVSTIVAAIFLLILLFGALIIVVVAFSNYNLSANQQMQIEQERSQEKIELTHMEVNMTEDEWVTEILWISISNTGSIEVKIRAIYEIVNGETKLLFDPTDYENGTIAPATTDGTILVPPAIQQIPFNATDQEAKIIAATERGTKTLDAAPTLIFEPDEDELRYDPTKLYIGPLMLEFTNFTWQKVDKDDGNLLPDDWQPGWVVNESSYYAWRISVMDIDNRSITINRFSSFNLVETEGPSVLSWYLEPTNDTSRTQFLQVNQTQSITYIWKDPKEPSGNTAVQINVPQGKKTIYMVFLTFFGAFHEADGTETPYAQTIPFEASVTVTGG